MHHEAQSHLIPVTKSLHLRTNTTAHGGISLPTAHFLAAGVKQWGGRGQRSPLESSLGCATRQGSSGTWLTASSLGVPLQWRAPEATQTWPRRTLTLRDHFTRREVKVRPRCCASCSRWWDEAFRDAVLKSERSRRRKSLPCQLLAAHKNPLTEEGGGRRNNCETSNGRNKSHSRQKLRVGESPATCT